MTRSKWLVETSLHVGTLIQSLADAGVLDTVAADFQRSLKAQSGVLFVNSSLTGETASTRLQILASSEEQARKAAAESTRRALGDAGKSMDQQIRFGWTQIQSSRLLKE